MHTEATQPPPHHANQSLHHLSENEHDHYITTGWANSLVLVGVKMTVMSIKGHGKRDNAIKDLHTGIQYEGQALQELRMP